MPASPFILWRHFVLNMSIVKKWCHLFKWSMEVHVHVHIILCIVTCVYTCTCKMYVHVYVKTAWLWLPLQLLIVTPHTLEVSKVRAGFLCACAFLVGFAKQRLSCNNLVRPIDWPNIALTLLENDIFLYHEKMTIEVKQVILDVSETASVRGL